MAKQETRDRVLWGPYSSTLHLDSEMTHTAALARAGSDFSYLLPCCSLLPCVFPLLSYACSLLRHVPPLFSYATSCSVSATLCCLIARSRDYAFPDIDIGVLEHSR